MGLLASLGDCSQGMKSQVSSTLSPNLKSSFPKYLS